jgi:hypothetical protein
MAETKELKRRVRDIIDPTRNLGHVDSHVKKPDSSGAPVQPATSISGQLPPQSPIMPSQDAEKDIPFVMKGNDPSHTRGRGAKRVASGAEPEGSKTILEEVGANGKVVISGGEGVFFCRPGDEDCG